MIFLHIYFDGFSLKVGVLFQFTSKGLQHLSSIWILRSRLSWELLFHFKAWSLLSNRYLCCTAFLISGTNDTIKPKSVPQNRKHVIHCSIILFYGGIYNDITGKIRSPYYPEIYRNNMNCRYEIKAVHGSIINLKFDYFDVEFVIGCFYDSVKVRLHKAP